MISKELMDIYRWVLVINSTGMYVVSNIDNYKEEWKFNLVELSESCHIYLDWRSERLKNLRKIRGK